MLKDKYSKFASKWESDPKFKPWLQACPFSPFKAFCKFCKTSLAAHRTALTEHLETQKHIKNAKPFSTGRTLANYGFNDKAVENTVKQSELKTAALWPATQVLMQLIIWEKL